MHNTPHHSQQLHHSRHSRRFVVMTSIVSTIVVMAAAVAVFMAFGGGFVGERGSAFPSAAQNSPEVKDLSKDTAAPQPAVEHHGNSPECPDTDCIALMVNGDLLFHPHLWEHFEGPDTSATDGTAFDFTPLFEPMKRYMAASDISVCNFETPIAQRGGPYYGYPVFAIPPEVVDAAANVGYTACTHATNHSWDQGAAGINRLWDELEAKGIAQTGSYKTEEDSKKTLVIDSPTGGGKLGLVTGTVSLNGQTADHDWRIDRLRDSNDPQHQADIDKAVARAEDARGQGADVVAIAMHSVQEYLDVADSWQQMEAHKLADTGAFDVIYGTGCHCAQPIEKYKDTWIVYGLGNAVTTNAPASRVVNNQGITARIQFAGKKGVAGSWRVSRIDWLPTANERRGQYRWCPLSTDAPDGVCWSQAQDAQVRQRLSDVIYSMGADRNFVREWIL